MRLHDLRTPTLWVDLALLDANIDAMAAARPRSALRPHVKAFKSTALARHVRDRGGHRSLCCATLRELEGLVDAGLDDDLLLANETLDGARLEALVARSPRRLTVAVDSEATLAAATTARRRGELAVLLDVNVGLPRCGCPPSSAGALADSARAAGLEVRGVMGYEGHVVGNPDRAWRVEQVAASMALLAEAHRSVGGDVVSAGGTGTFDLHPLTTEVQAGSYLLMDTHYARLGLPFRCALFVEATVLSVNDDRYAVADAGLKAFGMDHGEPDVDGYRTFFTSDEHATFLWEETRPTVGDRVRMTPAHVDPTVALHEELVVVDTSDPEGGGEVLDRWPVDLRGW